MTAAVRLRASTRSTAGDVVERHGVGGDAHVVIHADEPGARARAALVVHVRKGAHQRLFDGAVITAVEHQHALPPGDRARPAQCRAIRVGGGLRHLPERQAKHLREFFADARHALRRQHRGDAHRAGLGQRARDGGRRMAEHRAGVAEAEIDVGVAVDVFDFDAARLAHEQRMRRAPVAHPVHGHAVEPVRGAGLREPRGFGVRGGERFALRAPRACQRFAVDAGAPRVVHGEVICAPLRRARVWTWAWRASPQACWRSARLLRAAWRLRLGGLALGGLWLAVSLGVGLRVGLGVGLGVRLGLALRLFLVGARAGCACFPCRP